MIPDASTLVVVLAGLVALAAGYLAGSVPVAALVGRRAGAPDAADARDVWRSAGPGPGLLALAGELARGALPVAVAIVTVSWAGGAAAGIGAVAGTAWPPAWWRRGGSSARRRPAGGVMATFAGVAYALAPAAATLALAPTLVAAIAGRGVVRDPLPASVVTFLVAYPILFGLAAPDVSRLLALVPLYAVVLLDQLSAGR